MTIPTTRTSGSTATSTADAPEVVVRDLDVDDMGSASALLAAIWRRPGGSPVDTALLVALHHGGNYVAGAFVDHHLAGVCVGFFATPLGQTLHSHIAGVSSEHAGRGVGRRLKEHQREWARQRGLATITWTFDPLVARNAYFNLHRLSARATGYLVNFYGALHDGLNSGHDSDRLLVSWPTVTGSETSVPPRPPASPPALLVTGPDGGPLTSALPSGSAWCTVAMPRDIEALRAASPKLATRWRHHLRTALGGLLDDGWEVVDVDPAGHYLLRRP